MRYTIRPATSADLDTLMALRSEAEAWLRAAGIQQWTEDYAEHGHRILRDAVDRGVTWLITAPDGSPAGAVTLNGPDLDFWQPADDPGDALYVYKMIVARGHDGIGLGDAILDWASRRAEAAGRSWIRLDCRRDNYQLHAYYKARGFEHVRTVLPPPRPTNSGALFQRQAGCVVDVPTHSSIERAVVIEDEGAPDAGDETTW
jgi:ribosomal protein S18 acetylase RimI-like enzyme